MKASSGFEDSSQNEANALQEDRTKSSDAGEAVKANSTERTEGLFQCTDQLSMHDLFTQTILEGRHTIDEDSTSLIRSGSPTVKITGRRQSTRT